MPVVAKLAITPNVPQQISLRYTEGKLCEGRFGDQVYFTLQYPPDTCMYLDLGPAQKINDLAPKRGQLFNICKRWSGKKTESPKWDVWAIGAGEQPPAPSPAPAAIAAVPDTVEQQLRTSLAAIEQQKRQTGAVSPAPVATAPSTGQQPHSATGSAEGNGRTNGKPPNGNNGAPPSYGAGIKIPMNVALREIVEFTTSELKTAGLHLEGGPIQDLISTFVIGGMREGWIGPWQRGGAK